MYPKIKDIPFPEIRELAIKRHGAYDPQHAEINDFTWDSSPEGHFFWSVIERFCGYPDDDGVIDKLDLQDIMNTYSETKSVDVT